MKFTLEIQLGNDAMQTRDDVIDALRGVIAKLYRGSQVLIEQEHKIQDVNGNTCGGFYITDEEGL